ncbi:MAG: PDZ domain-containing protein [Proteobacteria bacterium]|nr:PDZ domain-containing protein [Pseudomonadota bacterium]
MPRATADKLTADPVTYTKGVRGYASYGGIEGFRIYAIRPGSVLAAIGIANGDTVRTVNGAKVTSVDQLNEQLAAIKAASAWTLQLERRAAPLTITITVK